MKHSAGIVAMLLVATAQLFAVGVPATVSPVSNTCINGNPVLVPEVQKLQVGSGVFTLPEKLVVAFPDSEALIAEQLSAALKRFGVKVVRGEKAAVCRFDLSDDGTPEHPQGYRLVIDEDGIRVTARTGAGLFYGAQTLLNLIRNAERSELAHLSISDWPDFNRRGYFLTIRNMKSEKLPALKQRIHAMASLKMNWLLLSIEEAFPYQGVRLSNRKNSFTAEEMKDLIEFCRARHIEITPAMQLWSHALWMTYHPDWDKMSEGEPSKPWQSQSCPHSREAKELIEKAVKEQIALFRPKIFFIMMDEIYFGPYGKCPRCRADSNLTATYIRQLKFLEDTVRKCGVRPMVCQDSFEDGRWPYGKSLRKALDREDMILWWSYRDQLPVQIAELFKGFRLVGHSLAGKPFNTQNMLRAIRANGGKDSTLVYWYYSATGQFIDLKTECPDSLGGFVNGMDYMWKYRETPYWQLAYDGTTEMIRRLNPAMAALPKIQNATAIPLERVVNSELGSSGYFPVLDDNALEEIKGILAARPERFRLLTAKGGRYYAIALNGTPGGTGRNTISFNVNRKAAALSLLMTASRPIVDLGGYRSIGSSGKKRWRYAPAAKLSLEYADGKKVAIPLRYRYDFTDWNRPFGGFNTTFAVRGLDAKQAHYNFCTVMLPNPRPEVAISRIHYTTERLDGVIPAILAASLIGADKPCGRSTFEPEAVADRPSAFGDNKSVAPKIDWVVDFTKGTLGKARIITRDNFPANFARYKFVDDPKSPAGGKVLRVTLPATKGRGNGGYCRLNLDIPASLPPGTNCLYLETKMRNVRGFSHCNLYLVEKDSLHHWGCTIPVQENWTTGQFAFGNIRDLAPAGRKLRGIDKVKMIRLTFFFRTVDATTEISIGRIGCSSGALPPDLGLWTVTTEAEPW